MEGIDDTGGSVLYGPNRNETSLSTPTSKEIGEQAAVVAYIVLIRARATYGSSGHGTIR